MPKNTDIVRFETVANQNQTWTKSNAVFGNLYAGFTTKTGKTPVVWLDYATRRTGAGHLRVTIENIYCTDAKHIGKGYGTALMTAFIGMIMDQADYAPVVITIPNCNEYSAQMAYKLGFSVTEIEGQNLRFIARFEHKDAVSTVTPAQVEAALNTTKEESPVTIETIKAAQKDIMTQIAAAKKDGNTTLVSTLAAQFNALTKQKNDMERAARPVREQSTYVQKPRNSAAMNYWLNYAEAKTQAGQKLR